MPRTKTKVHQSMIARALRAARDADLDITSYVICEESGEVRIYTDLGAPMARTTDIDAAVDAWK